MFGGRMLLVEHDVELVRLRNLVWHPDATPFPAYHGAYAFPPNREAIHVLATEILPQPGEGGFVPQSWRVARFAREVELTAEADATFLGSEVEQALVAT